MPLRSDPSSKGLDATRPPRTNGATVMLIVDRNESEGQLSGWVERLVGEMKGINIEYATSRAKLQQL
jgi:type I restriction enzyme, R subunit